MRYHLYKKIKTCPMLKSDVELTEEIKKHIIENRIYNPPKYSDKLLLELEYYKNRKMRHSISYY